MTAVDELGVGTVSVVGALLRAIPREMATKLEQAAFSSIIREAKDFAVALADTSGRVFAQADCIPILNAGIGSVAAHVITAPDFDADSLTPDSAILANDPYAGAQHLQDVFLITPMFVGSALFGYAISCAHHVDVGGGTVGQNVGAREIYEEGLRFPSAPFSISKDWRGNGFVSGFIRANIRMPDLVLADMNGQLSANLSAAQRLHMVTDRYGLEVVQAVAEELMNYSERRLRQVIRDIPDGIYRGEGHIEARRFGRDRLPILATVTVAGDTVDIDFEGTGDQVDGYINCPFASTVSVAQSAVYSLAPQVDFPFNDGCVRPVTVRAPEGSILNPRWPAAVRARMTPASRTHDVILRAMEQALPDRVAASGFDTSTGVSLSWRDPETQQYDSVVESLGGGWGAWSEGDGGDAMATPIANTSVAPAEVLEAEYSFFRVVDYSFIEHSGGVGLHGGGRGLARTYEILEDGVKVDAFSDRHEHGAPGSHGGTSGGRGRFTVRRAGQEAEELENVASLTLNRGDRVTISTGGGGGYGER